MPDVEGDLMPHVPNVEGGHVPPMLDVEGGPVLFDLQRQIAYLRASATEQERIS